jgi:heme/copper-type cytochrome/quinol oxidase subunit 3
MTGFWLSLKKNTSFTNRQKKSMQTQARTRPHHGYHLVDPSPWPALTRLCVLW